MSPPPHERVAALLRIAVREHAASERRRSHPAILHVGTPGLPHQVFALSSGEHADHALRTDVVAAMRRRTRSGDASTVVWLTRSGPLELTDSDAAWFAAARQAFAEADAPLVFAVVNRHGWWDPSTGAGRQWRRLRPA